MNRTNRTRDILVTHEDTDYMFDPDEPGYTTTDIIALTLKRKLEIWYVPVPCELCKATAVYFGHKNSTNPSNYICSDCYQKIID